MNNIPENIVDASNESLPDIKLVEISYHEKYNVFDIQLKNIELLTEYDFVELDISCFPLSRKIRSINYNFEPFEHYIDETKTATSMYRSQQDLWEHLSWLSTTAILTWIVAEFNPKNITETESLATLVIAYLGGMKAWPTIESFFINRSAKWKLQFKERYYHYIQNIAATWEKYDNDAKKERYNMENIRPDQIGIVIDSIRQKMRLRFTKKQLLALPKDANKVNVMNISLSDELRDEFFKKWIRIWVHIKLWDKVPYLPILKTRTELIQTLKCKWWKDTPPIIWCIPKMWDPILEWSMEHRETIAIDRIKYYKQFDIQSGDIIDYKYKPENKWPLVPECTVSDNL